MGAPSILSIIFIVLVIAIFILMISRYDVLRDESTCAAGDKPYSLSRVQLAFWSVIIICAFIHLWGLNDFDPNSVDLGKTSLILLGISASAGILGRTIDGSDQSQVTAGKMTTRHQDVCSEGFWKDILSDSNGVSIHRFQNVMFTIILMSSYIISVYNGTIPDFNDNLLILSGVSSGTYLGVKMTENK